MKLKFILIFGFFVAECSGFQLEEPEDRNIKINVDNKLDKLIALDCDFASWRDNDSVVYWSSKQNTIFCENIIFNRVVWKVPCFPNVIEWSGVDARRLAVICKPKKNPLEYSIHVFDTDEGTTLFHADRDRLANLLGSTSPPQKVTVVPSTGSVVICCYSTGFGPNGFVLSPKLDSIECKFDIDANVRELSLSPNGAFASMVADNKVLNIRDIYNNKDIFFRGRRIFDDDGWGFVSMDSSKIKNSQYDGTNILVYAIQSRKNSRVEIFNLNTNEVNVIRMNGASLLIDCNFKSKKLLLVGESQILLRNLESNKQQQVHWKQPSLIVDAKFSPLGDKILVVDNLRNLYTFTIVKKESKVLGAELWSHF